MSKKTKVLIRGPILTRSGYGEQTRFAYRALTSRPDLFDVYLAPTNWGNTSWIVDDSEERIQIDENIRNTTIYAKGCQDRGEIPFDASVQVTIPQEWQTIAPKNIGYTAGTETTLISHKWVESCRNVDKIIAVSNHTKAAFDNTVYEGTDENGRNVTARNQTPVDVVNFPTKEYETHELDFKPETGFNFLCVAQWSTRKNMPTTIQGFLNEFYSEDVGLILKTNFAKNCLLDRMHCEAQIKGLLKTYEKNMADIDPEKLKQGQKCKIYLLHGGMTDEEMASLYKHPDINALINIAHGEGFGLPMFEAAQAGLPIIAPNWGGQKDFLNAPVTTKARKGKKAKTRVRFLGTKVDYDIRQIQKEAVWDTVLIEQSQWCYIRERSYQTALKQVYKNPDRALGDAKKLQAHIKENFSEEAQNAKFVKAVLDTLDQKKPQTTSVLSI